MSNSVFLKPDENGNWGSTSPTYSVVALQEGATAVGNGTVLDVSQYSTLVLNLVFSGTATVITEGSVDGTSWDAVGGYGLVSGFINIQNSAFSSNNRARYYIAGLRYFRARISSYTSGTVDIQAECTSATLPYLPATINTNADAAGLGYYSVNSSYNYGFAGASFDRVRVGKTYKYIEYLNLPTATATTIWTPSAGKKFRLMGVQFGASAAAQCALRDGTAGSGTAFHMFKVGGADTKDFSFGNGYLSSAANNVLEIYNVTGSTVSVWVTAWGTEE